jgi:IMP cyclohydrolase
MEDGRHRLKSNPYPGRGIVTGLDASGRYAVQLYFITGRSAGSRNRVLVIEDGDVRTQPFDEAARTDDPNVYYRAITSAGDRHIVSNGNHTDVIAGYLTSGRSFEAAVLSTSYETDAPNYTPRIAGLADLRGSRPVLHLASAARGTTVDVLHSIYTYGALDRGAGYCLTTYRGDGDPLPSFTERPFEFPLNGTPEEAAAELWDLLPADKRVALALKAVEIETKRVAKLTVRNALG